MPVPFQPPVRDSASSFGTPRTSPRPATSSIGSNFMKELGKVNEQNAAVSVKLVKENKRKQILDEEIESYTQKLKTLRAQTGNGSSIREGSQATNKEIHKLENRVVMSRNKLSAAKTENAQLFHKINERRKDKNLMLRIYNEMEVEFLASKKRSEELSDELNDMHERKHRLQVELLKVKEQMVKGMEVFSRELDSMKETIEHNQNSLLEGIRDKLSLSAASMYTPNRTRTSTFTNHVDTQIVRSVEEDMNALLHEAGVSSVEELVLQLQADEDIVFSRYKDVQEQTEELEKMETHIKHLELDLQAQNMKIEAFEAQSLNMQKDIEVHIAQVKKQVSKYESECTSNLNLLTAMNEGMTNLLRNISQEGNSLDQHLLSSGINERNLEICMSMIEERVDFVIQMAKAAAKERLEADDFRAQSVPGRKTGKELIPSLPALNDNILDDEEVETEESSKLRPVNIAALKDFMIKKVNKHAQQSMNSPAPGHRSHGFGGSGEKQNRHYGLTPKNLQSNASHSQGGSGTSSPNKAARMSFASVSSGPHNEKKNRKLTTKKL